MPKLYAYNTSATQIKKRYAMIGSTATQIKKKYAMIGSTATLVYSAEETFTTNCSYSTWGQAFTTNIKYVSCGNGFTKATITIEMTGSSGIQVAGLSSSVPTWSNSGDTPANSLYSIKSNQGSATGTHTKTVTLNSNTNYYIYTGGYYSSEKGATAKITVVFE